MNQRETRNRIIEALKAQGLEAVSGKGGFFIKGQGFVTFAKARRLTGLEAPKRERRERILYGDAAIVHLIAGKI